MVRTQVYLTEQQRDELAGIAKAVGRKQSDLSLQELEAGRRFLQDEG